MPLAAAWWNEELCVLSAATSTVWCFPPGTEERVAIFEEAWSLREMTTVGDALVVSGKFEKPLSVWRVAPDGPVEPWSPALNSEYSMIRGVRSGLAGALVLAVQYQDDVQIVFSRFGEQWIELANSTDGLQLLDANESYVLWSTGSGTASKALWTGRIGEMPQKLELPSEFDGSTFSAELTDDQVLVYGGSGATLLNPDGSNHLEVIDEIGLEFATATRCGYLALTSTEFSFWNAAGQRIDVQKVPLDILIPPVVTDDVVYFVGTTRIVGADVVCEETM